MADVFELEKELQRFVNKANHTQNNNDVSPESKAFERVKKQIFYKCTDTGNGERFANQHKGSVRYCYPMKKWFVWDGKRWKQDDTGRIMQMGKETVRRIYNEASKADDRKIRKSISSWAKSSESKYRRKALIECAESEPGIPILPNELDKNPWLFNVDNGTLDLKTGELLPHSKKHMITKLSPVEFVPDEDGSLWEDFLYQIMNEDEELVNFLKRAVGYALTGITNEQCLFFLYGTGANGKSTFLNVIQSIFGDYSQQTDFSTFIVKQHHGIRNDIARMKSARLVCAIEAGDGTRFDEPVIKHITGGDTVTARFLHQEFFEFNPEFKIFLAANHKPNIYGTDDAIWRRIRLIPFNLCVPPENQDPDLPDRLIEEKSGILNWFLQGCLEWQRERLNPPDEVMLATKQYRSEMDILGDFFTSNCAFGEEFRVKNKDIYDEYTKWCEENSEDPIKQRTFSKKMMNQGFLKIKIQGWRYWKGVGLKKEILL